MALNVVYTQPWIGDGKMWSSQIDTSGGFGNFATTYDNFTLTSSVTVTRVAWTGGFFNPGLPASIQSFDLTFWADNSGQPGGVLSTFHITGNANPTFLGNFIDQLGNSNPMYSYFADIAGFAATAGTKYWLSPVASVPFPPQWGWAYGSGGDSASYQDFFGTRSPLANDLAFTLYAGTPPPPPPPPNICAPSLPLERVDAFELDNGLQDWQRTVSVPQFYNESDTPTVTVELARAPSDIGTISMLYTPLPTTLDGTGIPLTVPDEFSMAILWGALGDLLSQDGEGADPKRAEYCRMRYDLGVELCQILLRGNLTQ